MTPRTFVLAGDAGEDRADDEASNVMVVALLSGPPSALAFELRPACLRTPLPKLPLAGAPTDAGEAADDSDKCPRARFDKVGVEASRSKTLPPDFLRRLPLADIADVRLSVVLPIVRAAVL